MAKPPKKIKPAKPAKPNRQEGEKGKQIKGRFATRDANSGAVVYNDQAGYQKAIKRKRAGKDMVATKNLVSENEKRLTQIEQELANTNFKLDQILDRLDNP